MSELTYLTKKDGVALLVLKAPPANTYSYEMMQEIDAHILDIRMDASIDVCVITGDGEKFFCAGADIDMLNGATPYFKYNFCLHANETMRRIENTPKIFVAALNGHCVGGGLEVALACDFRVAWSKAGGTEELPEGNIIAKAKVGLPEVKLGVLPGTGGTARLTKLLGGNKAMELMTHGENMSLLEANEIGIVNHIFDGDDRHAFLMNVWNYVQGFCRPNNASMAAGLIKRSVQVGQGLSLDDHLALERELQQRLFTSADAKEGILAFNEKRKADFSGC